jgi:fibronectin type 3 domain-containing protein
LPVGRSRQQLCSLAALALVSCAGLHEEVVGSFFRSDEELVFDPASDLLPPDSARVTSNEDRQISLSWNPVLIGDVAGYAVLSAASPQGPYTRLGTTELRFGTVFSDAGAEPGALGDGQTYFYRVHAYDSTGRVSRNHANLVATTEAPPPVPEGLQVYSNLPRAVVLNWEPSERRTVHGYAVYRCPTMAGPWERVTYVEKRLNTVYVDEVPGDLRVMYYRISALNRFGGESGWTDAIRAVTKAEPLPPIGLAVATRRLGEVRIGWEANVEPDLVGYEIWRSQRDGGGWGERQLLAQVPQDEGAFRDGAVGCGETVSYELRALDADGLISEFSRPLEVTGEDIGLRLEHNPTSGTWELQWDAQRMAGWPAVRIVQIRRGLPDREFGRVSDSNRFTLPEQFRATGQLAVTPVASEIGTARPGSEKPDHPSCRIEVP